MIDKSELWTDDYETGDFLWYWMDKGHIIGGYRTQAEAEKELAEYNANEEAKKMSTPDSLNAWHAYEAKATAAFARQDWGNAQANAGLALAAIRELAGGVDTSELWTDDSRLTMIDAAILMTKVMIEATDRHAMELNARAEVSYWRDFGGWYWRDGLCLEPMGPFDNIAEAKRDHHNCRMESQDDD